MRSLLSAYSRASIAAPLSTAFATCLAKGSASDAIAQVQVEKAEKIDWKRNFAFAFFSGAYLGVGQHYVYNVAFGRIFGNGQDVMTALKKCVADSTIHVPMIYLPLYYPFKTVMLGEGTALDGLNRYTKHDALPEFMGGGGVLTTYWSMWPAFHFVNFKFTPPELRIGLVAGVSFLWLIYLSYASHKEEPSR